MAELLVVSNPSRRRRRKMSALQRKYFGKRRHRKARSHRRRRTHSRRRHRAVGYTVGSRPIRRRKLNPHRRHRSRRRHHVHHYRRHRHRHNPFRVGGITRQVMPTVKAGFTGSLGALGLDALWGRAYPRINTYVGGWLDNPYVGFAAKAFGAVIVGTVGGKVLRGRHTALATGAMTVVTHDFLKSLLQQMMPTVFGPGGAVPLGAYLSGSAPIVGTATIPQAYLPFGDPGQGGIVPAQFGAYMSGSSGDTSDSGQYQADRMGIDPWNG